MVGMTLSIIVVALPGLKPLLNHSTASKGGSSVDTVTEHGCTEQPKSSGV
jgi:hypothetical protein